MIEKTEQEAMKESGAGKHMIKKTHKGEVEVEDEDLSILEVGWFVNVLSGHFWFVNGLPCHFLFVNVLSCHFWFVNVLSCHFWFVLYMLLTTIEYVDTSVCQDIP